MATQFDPIAKDESLNTTEVTPRNIADVLAEELSAIGQAIAGGSGESVTLTKQSSAIDTTTLSAKSKAGNLHFFGYFHNDSVIASGTTIYTFADHLPSIAQTILALNTNGSVASVIIYEDGRVYVASTMAVGYWVLVGEVWEQ